MALSIRYDTLAESAPISGHIISLVLGIPHVLVDNSIGKLGDYHSTWTKDCPLGHLVRKDDQSVSENGSMLQQVEDIYSRWIVEGKISGLDF